MAITPITPIDREKLVPTSTSIIIDFDGVPTLVDVNGVVVFDGSFQSGWSGSLLNKPGGGKRLVLDPPSAFVLGTLVSVLATENGNQVLGYIFETGTEKITADDKNSSPRVVETGFAQKAIPAPTWHQTFDGGGSPQVDEQGNYDMTVEGLGADFQQPGKINLAIDLDGAAYLKAETPLTDFDVYELEVELTNGGGALTDFQVRVVLDTATLIGAGKMDADCSVRFLDSGDNDLDWWLEGPVNDANTTYWVKIPSLPAGVTDIKIRYSGQFSYKDKNDTENPDGVFEFFDGFDYTSSSLDASKWTEVDASSLLSTNGDLLTGGAGPNNWGNTTIYSNAAFDRSSQQYVLESRHRRLDNVYVMFGWKDNGAGASYTDFVYAWYDASNAGASQVYEDGANKQSSGNRFSTNQWAILQVETKATGAEYRWSVDDRQTFNLHYSSAYSSENPLRAGYVQYDGTWQADWVLVRKAGAQPSIVLGAESTLIETYPPNSDPLRTQLFSIEGWVYIGGTGTERVLATSGRSADHGWELRMTAANRLRMTVYDGAGGSHSQQSTTTFSAAGVWVHVGVAVDAANEVMEITVNGFQEAASPGSWGFTTIAYDNTNLAMEMGRNVIGDTEYWPSRLDQWRYYDGQLLDEVQFRVRYQEGEPPDPKPYVAYVKDPGELYLRRDEPLTPEVKVVDGEIVDIGYDPKLDKFIVFFVNNDRVFVTSADPGDGPTSLTQPSALTTNVRLSAGPNQGGSQSLTTEDFPPIKLALPLDSSLLSGGAGGQVGSWQGDFVAVTPSIINLEPSVIRMARPAQEASGSLAIGFIPLKFTAEVTAVRRLPFVPLPEGAGFADYEDPAPTPGARYACIVVYRRGAGQFEGPRGGGAERPTAADVALLSGGSSGATHSLTTEDFPPLKLALPLDNIDTSGGSQGRSFSFFSTGFGDIGVGS